MAPAHREFRPGTVHSASGFAVEQIAQPGRTAPAPAQNRAVAWLANFHFTDLDLASLHSDEEGGIFYADEFKLEAVPAAVASDPVVAAAAVPVSPFPANLIFHSKPGAPNVIYLNFNGETVQNTAWNTSLGRR